MRKILNIKNLVLSIILLSIFSCTSKTDEEKKIEIDNLYSTIKVIPASKPCENLNGYNKLKSLESRYGTDYYKTITNQKILKYKKECETLKEELEKERLRLIELNKLGTWEYGNYVDDFGDPTGKKYIQNTSFGSFSNTATDNSSLKVEMMISSDKQDAPWFRIYEYGSMKIKGYYDYKYYPCKIKSSDEEIFHLRLKIEDGWDFFRIVQPGRWDGKDYTKKWGNIDKLNKLIQEGKSAKFSCYDSDTPSSTYRFDLYFNYYENALRKMQEL